MNPREKHAAIVAAMQNIVDVAKRDGRDITEDEMTDLEAKSAEALELKGLIERSEKSAALIASIAGTVDSEAATDIYRGVMGNTIHEGQKGHVLLAGAQGKLQAKHIAEQIRAQYGQKAFAASGALTSTVPLLPTGPFELGKVPTSVLDILRTTAHDTPTWRYLRQTVATNNAAIVAPGGTKPTSVVTVDDIDGQLAVFAHLSEYIDEYLLRDNDQLSRFLASQLLYMLQQKVEDEVLNGNGSAGHLLGILQTSGIQTQAFVTDKLTTLRTAAMKLENLGYTPDVFVLNITDWAAIETARNTSGAFDLNGPIDRASQKIWGTQVVTSGRIAAGTALALDVDALGLDIAAEGIEVKWDTATGFDKNQVRARVEGRFGVSVYTPTGIVKATITGA